MSHVEVNDAELGGDGGVVRPAVVARHEDGRAGHLRRIGPGQRGQQAASLESGGPGTNVVVRLPVGEAGLGATGRAAGGRAASGLRAGPAREQVGGE